jgi:hypothetical protein
MLEYKMAGPPFPPYGLNVYVYGWKMDQKCKCLGFAGFLSRANIKIVLCHKHIKF